MSKIKDKLVGLWELEVLGDKTFVRKKDTCGAYWFAIEHPEDIDSFNHCYYDDGSFPISKNDLLSIKWPVSLSDGKFVITVTKNGDYYIED